MEQRRKTHFPANDCTVITGLCANGEYGAYRENEDEGRVRGYGHTRLAAIADLVEAIGNTEEEEADSYSAFQLDRARDYRKHEVV